MSFLIKIRNFSLKFLFPNKYNSEQYIKFLRKKGVKIGKGSYFFDAINTQIDVNRPYLLEIGNFCKVTKGVQILSHDYSSSVLRLVNNDTIKSSAKKTIIGNNVFIGIHSIILPGAKIGDNVIIGAGSVVSGTFPSNVVIGGNPAKIIKDLDSYSISREDKYLEEAILYALEFEFNTQRYPTIKEMGDFYPLYFAGDLVELRKLGVNVRSNGDDLESFETALRNNEPLFNDFDEFILCVKKYKNEVYDI